MDEREGDLPLFPGELTACLNHVDVYSYSCVHSPYLSLTHISGFCYPTTTLITWRVQVSSAATDDEVVDRRAR